MSFFSKAANPEPEETVEAAWIRREAELLAEIRAFDSQIATLQSLIATFRYSHMAIVNRQLAFMTSDITLVDGLRERWSSLCSEAARLGRERNAALAAWSTLCSNPREVSHHGD